MNTDKIGRFIKELRTSNNLSQYQLAEQIPISRQAVSKWERGETIPDSSTLLRLSDIFKVSINELLNGERLETNSLKQLEQTTLNLVDDSNKKSKKIKRIAISSITIISILVILFLVYYFANSYNSIKVYKFYTNSKNFDIYDGIMIKTKQKSYFKIGKIKPKNNHTINNITLYYKNNNKKNIIIKSDDDIEQIRYFYQRYSSLIPFNSIISNSYITINYDDNKKETIKLHFIRDYSNNNLLFLEKFKRLDNSNIDTKVAYENTNNDEILSYQEKDTDEVENVIRIETKEDMIEEMMEKAISKEINSVNNNDTDNDSNEIANKEESSDETKLDLIKQLGFSNDGNYVYVTTVNNQEIKFVYYTKMNQVMMYIDGIEEWNYIHYAKIYRCRDIPNGLTNNLSNCKNYVNETINKYVK